VSIWLWVLSGLAVFLIAVAVHNVLQTKHAILHNYPVFGYGRYWIERLGPMLRQYLVADDNEEQPFNRNERTWIYATAKGQDSMIGFGSEELQYAIGYPIIKHAAQPYPEHEATWPGDDPTAIPAIKVMGTAHGRARPYRVPSVVNISGMSFGALGRNAVSALNQGAGIAGCYQNTGEGGVSRYHESGSDLIWQLGTGYFGALDAAGQFSLDKVAETCSRLPQIRAIEIKLSQGAKPGKGGMLPSAKVVPEIAAARQVPEFEDVYSPNAHSEFNGPDALIDFVERVAARTGLPVGIKSAVGEIRYWEQLAERMKTRGEGPDFITIDGGEGGTGAAPPTYADHVSLPFKIAFKRVYTVFQRTGISQDVFWIGSGKLGFPDRTVVALAMGCDSINMARETLLSVGCIQSLACHTGHCPTGITTMNAWRQAGLHIPTKAQRCGTFIQGLRKELLSLAHTSGYQHPSQFTMDDIEVSSGINLFIPLRESMGYLADDSGFMSMEELTPV
jgi:glutamate synthase domain-containing protein 2